MKASLQQNQSLVITQGLRQAISMLSLNSMQLDELVDAELQTNPALKFDDDEEAPWLSTNSASTFDVAIAKCASPANFRDHLLKQLSDWSFNAMTKIIARSLIHNLDDNGLLSDAPEVFSFIMEEHGVFPEWIEVVRLRLMDLDPLGCGAKDINEALTHQVNRIFIKKPEPFLAILQKIGHDKTKVFPQSALLNAMRGVDMEKLKQLRPKPTASFHELSFLEQKIYTDVIITQDLHGIAINLVKEPSKRISLLNVAPQEEAKSKTMRDGVRRAQNLHKALFYREQSLLKVTKIIVMRQSDWFFNEGELAPLILAEVARDSGLHQSTISRLASVNSLTCNRGTFRLKYFFGGHLPSGNKNIIYSTTAVKIKLQKLIQEENKNSPLSDQEMATLLLNQGIEISRRTVTKYRKLQNIPPAQKRRRIIAQRPIDQSLPPAVSIKPFHEGYMKNCPSNLE